MSTTLTFDESATQHILESFGRDIDEDGFVINPDTGKRETNSESEEICAEHFAGLEKGSIIFLDDDFNTLVDHVKRRQGE